MENTAIKENIGPAENALNEAGDWHLKLFQKSVLKQTKLAEITNLIGETATLRCLDLGSDNGVISYYLRRRGGEWHSADLTQEAVDSITSLVHDRVQLVEGSTLEYEDCFFDLVVVVDMLEHVEDDKEFISQLARIIKPGGLLIINAPNLKPGSPLRMFRHLIGQTDEAHGHLRAGYGTSQLEELLGRNFSLVSSKTYSRFFSELIDTLLVFAYHLLSKKSGAPEAQEEELSKGVLFTADDMRKLKRSFKLYSLIYPFVWVFSKLDLLIFFIPGFMRITAAKRK